MKKEYWIIGMAIFLFLLWRYGMRNYLEIMADAIQKQEGWFPGSASYQNNNPGNLVYAGKAGATGKDNRNFAIFDSYASGRLALIRQLQLAFENRSQYYHSGMTLYQFFARWTHTVKDQKPYAENVAEALGVSPGNTLDYVASHV